MRRCVIILWLGLVCIALGHTCCAQELVYKGIGQSDYFKNDNEKHLAQNQALLRAQRNALFAYGGTMQTYTTLSVNDANKKSNKRKFVNESEHDSFFSEISRQSVNALIVTLGNPSYEVKKDGKYKYVEAKGEFKVDPNKFDNLIDEFVSTTVSRIKLVMKSDAQGKKYMFSYLQEYFNDSDDKFLFLSDSLQSQTDFVLGYELNNIKNYYKTISYQVQFYLYYKEEKKHFKNFNVHIERTKEFDSQDHLQLAKEILKTDLPKRMKESIYREYLLMQWKKE